MDQGHTRATPELTAGANSVLVQALASYRCRLLAEASRCALGQAETTTGAVCAAARSLGGNSGSETALDVAAGPLVALCVALLTSPTLPGATVGPLVIAALVAAAASCCAARR